MADTAAAWFSATGTLLAVLVALFGPSWERFRRRPRLQLAADPPDELGTAAKVVGGRTETGVVTYWLRMAVSNAGRSTAEDVRVILLRIDAPQPLAKQPPSRELKWADVATDRGTLPPRVSRLVDIVHLTEATDSSGHERLGLVSGVMPLSAADKGQPDSLLWRNLDTGRYTVHVSVSARDVAAAHYALAFDVDTAASFDGVPTLLEKATAARVTRARTAP
jgi:hypothetical protein